MSVLQAITLHAGGGPLSWGGVSHVPLEHARCWLVQSSQGCPPCPHVADENPPAHCVVDAQQPLQLFGPHAGGGGGAASLASAIAASSPASPPVYPLQSRTTEHAVSESAHATRAPLRAR
jgi:hypothetical protein